jgi:CHAT domain
MAIKQRQYIDFKLYLTRPPDGKGACQVALLPTSEVGETITPVTVSEESGPPADLLPYLAAKSITLPNLVRIGKGLANWLLPEDTIRPLFLEALKMAGNEGGVRLRLIIADHGLKKLPWEYTYVNLLPGPDSMRGFIALEPTVSIVRHEPLPYPHLMPHKADTEPTSLRMVIAAASPNGQDKLDLSREVGIIQRTLKDINVGGILITTDQVLMDATGPEIVNALRGAGSTNIFHFVGHGNTGLVSDPFTRGATKEEGYVYLIDDKVRNTEAKVRADELAKYLQQAGVRLAVLGACYSGTRSERYPWDGVAGALAARAIPAIIAMQFGVYEPHAIAFSEFFYGQLVSGLSLDEAVVMGRMGMLGVSGSGDDQSVNIEWGVPVLYSRMPTGELFPEQLARSKPAAKQFQMAIQQAADIVDKTGEVIGVSIGQIIGGKGEFRIDGIEIDQQIGVNKGTIVGMKIGKLMGGLDAKVKQKARKVTTKLTGIDIDEMQ